jgi:hypothetical protein
MGQRLAATAEAADDDMAVAREAAAGDGLQLQRALQPLLGPNHSLIAAALGFAA